jgi:hypothetical protein
VLGWLQLWRSDEVWLLYWYCWWMSMSSTGCFPHRSYPTKSGWRILDDNYKLKLLLLHTDNVRYLCRKPIKSRQAIHHVYAVFSLFSIKYIRPSVCSYSATYLFIHMWVSNYLFLCLACLFHIFPCPSVHCLSVYTSPSIYLSIYLSVCLSIYLSTAKYSMYLPILYLCASLSTCLITSASHTEL